MKKDGLIINELMWMTVVFFGSRNSRMKSGLRYINIPWYRGITYFLFLNLEHFIN